MTQETKGIPPQIKRNTLYLALIQALVATGFQLVPSLGSLIMLRFTDVLALIGATLSMGKITGPLMSYPAGILADRRGRKSVLLLGVGLCGAGSLLRNHPCTALGYEDRVWWTSLFSLSLASSRTEFPESVI